MAPVSYSTLTTATLRTSSPPPSPQSHPPAPSLNLHYNKDKEGGGTPGSRWRGVKIGGVDGPGESDDLTAGQKKKAPGEQRSHKCVNDYVCVDLLCLYGGVGGKCICMWLHASGCCSFTDMYTKQMTPISYLQAAGGGVDVLVVSQ